MASDEHASGTRAVWASIVRAALIGVQRRSWQMPEAVRSDGVLQSALNSAQEADLTDERNSRSLLRAAAITALHRRAGSLPPRIQPQGDRPICPDDPLPRCSIPAGILLKQIASTGSTALLLEWAELAERHNVRAREEDLPDLLNLCKNRPALRSALLPALGERGRWLAARNPAWQGIVPSGDPHAWHEGVRQERLDFLTLLRERAPGQALELLAETWDNEQPADRSAFMSALETGLNNADEDFLEAALRDRSRDVRKTAARLLVRLPESRLVRRMTERAMQIVRWKFGLLRGSIEVSLPERWDTAINEDLGVYSAAPLPGNQILMQIIGGVPPRAWCAAWNKMPTAILQANRPEEWDDALLAGWTDAALRENDDGWLEALAAYETRRGDPKRQFDLFARLPYRYQEAILLSLFDGSPPSLAYDATASVWLSACRSPWSSELSQAVIRCIAWNLQRSDLQPWQWEILLREIGTRFHPDTLPTAMQQLGMAQRQRPRSDPFVNELLGAFEIRIQMHKAFSSSLPGENIYEPH